MTTEHREWKSGEGRSSERLGGVVTFVVEIAHAFGGALLFSFPLLMTMEMWWLGFSMSPLRMALFLAVIFAAILGISYFEGSGESWQIDVLDALIACAVGYAVAAAMLLLFAIIEPGMSAGEVIGKIAIHAMPGALGAILARRLLGIEPEDQKKKKHRAYGAKLFLMGVGAVYLALQLAPTEEMVLIAHKMTEWHAVALAVVSLFIMHLFIHTVERREQQRLALPVPPLWDTFLRYTAPGYALALVISLYVLWSFNRLDGMATTETAMAAIVLGLPAALGTSAARLIL